MEPLMRRWIISDTHFGHTALQAHARRPADVDARIIKNWKRLVKPTDLVIHLGDIAFTFVKLKEVLDDLPGIKWLTRGNHDPKSISWYMRNGFDFAADGIHLANVYYSHKPVVTLPDGATYNIHGHLHNRFAHDYRKYPHSRLFALEHTNYAPMLVETFLSKGMPGGEVLPRQAGEYYEQPKKEIEVTYDMSDAEFMSRNT